MYDLTARVEEARKYFDRLLDERLDKIAELSGVDRKFLIKINPADFVEKTRYCFIKGYQYKNIKDFILENKTDETFLISPRDAVEETAEQIRYKAGDAVKRKIRASKCEVIPVPRETALDFCIRNHRQSLPHVGKYAVYMGLVFEGELVALMGYDVQNGAVRGGKRNYELLRLAICRDTQVFGGASKLQKACEDVLVELGEEKIFSYSNATINSGSVYQKLGFEKKEITSGAAMVLELNNNIHYLCNLKFPYSTDKSLAARGQLKVHITGNVLWEKRIGKEDR